MVTRQEVWIKAYQCASGNGDRPAGLAARKAVEDFDKMFSDENPKEISEFENVEIKTRSQSRGGTDELTSLTLMQDNCWIVLPRGLVRFPKTFWNYESALSYMRGNSVTCKIHKFRRVDE